MAGFAERVFGRIVARPLPVILGCVVLTGVLGTLAAKVKPDYAVEYLFPERSRAKADYDRYKSIYPYEDARALVMVEAKDLFSAPGLARLAALEKDLATLTGVNDVMGPLSIKDVVDAGDETVLLEKLYKRAELPEEALAAKRITATQDPLFRWQLSPPDGRSVTIRVTLEKEYAAKEETRSQFLRDLRAAVARHAHEGQKIVISGLPIIRSEYVEMIERDKTLTTGLSLSVILALLLWIFRSPRDVVVALVTIIFSVLWTRGGMGLLGYPEQILTSILPTVVMIISISDTVHILSHYKDALAKGTPPKEALVHALADSAFPCLLTELTIAAGFLSLWFVDIRMISQFGVATAIGMLLTWLANMTVLPLAILALKPAPSVVGGAAGPDRAFRRFLLVVERLVVERPKHVVAVAASVLVAAGLVARFGMGMEYYAFDDLRPESPIKAEIAYAETTYGGCDPMVIFIEPKAGTTLEEPMLEPAVIRLADRLATHLEKALPAEVKNALSIADYITKAHRIFAGAEAVAADPYPATKNLVAQELSFIDDPKILRDYIDTSRRTLAINVPMPDVGTTRLAQIIDELTPVLAAEEKRLAAEGVPVTLTITGMFAIGEDIYRTLVGGLLGSLAGAIAVSLLVFSLVLRSWRLGLLALVPNLAPLALTFGVMGLTGIQLTPTTVIVFSITLVIADDDTVQFFARFRRRFAELVRDGSDDPHRHAALDTVKEAGLPMFITACSVSAGFLTLRVSEFLGLAHFGLLVGVSLFAAIFADLFLTPILLMAIKPKIATEGVLDGGRSGAVEAATPPSAYPAEAPPEGTP